MSLYSQRRNERTLRLFSRFSKDSVSRKVRIAPNAVRGQLKCPSQSCVTERCNATLIYTQINSNSVLQTIVRLNA
jgi:aspartate carbamoyltransferase regulatory subunit